MDMTGKTVLITGASRGIGAAAGRIFAAAGANVVLAARGEAEIAALAAEIGAELGAAALAVTCDVSDYSQVEAAVQAALERFGGLDVLIGNASVIAPIAHMWDADPADWGHTVDINLKGVFHGMRAALPVMQKAGGGTILTLSSGAAHGPLEGWSHYCAAKAGSAMLTSCLDKEARGLGIRALGLSPGTVATQMQRDIKASGINPVSEMAWEDHIPAEWPARALLWMCSPDADEFIGTEIRLRDADIRQRLGLA